MRVYAIGLPSICRPNMPPLRVVGINVLFFFLEIFFLNLFEVDAACLI